MKKVLFVCVENAGRSQMAEAFANAYGSGKITAKSAGTTPGERVNNTVVQVMWEKGIDISRNRPKLITEEMIHEADRVITMGCSVAEVCPAVFIRDVVDWNLEDPKGQPVQKVREIRDEAERLVRALIQELSI